MPDHDQPPRFVVQRHRATGDVIVWDTGTWRLRKADDARAALDSGELHAELYGEKLRGRIVLVRRGEPGEREQWLLVHKRDEHAVDGWEPLDHPRSVLSGRTNDDVRADADRIWRSDLPAAEARCGSGRHRQRSTRRSRLFPGREGEEPVTKRELLRLSRTVGVVVLELVSWKWEVKSRGGKARLDYTQNAINKTLVAPYSPRATAAGALEQDQTLLALT